MRSISSLGRGVAARLVSFDEAAIVHTVLADGGAGTMVDVGAHTGSALRSFAADGWFVHAIEPDPSNRARLEQRFGDHPRVSIDPRAIAKRDGDEVELFTSAVSTGISTLAPFHDSHVPSTTVTTVRLDTFIDTHGIEDVTFLKTDIEGYDLFALQTFPWSRTRPRAVLCEFEDRKTRGLGYTFDDIARFLTAEGYSVLVSEWYPVIEYGRTHRWRSIRPYPTTLREDDSWGNLIAVEPHDVSGILAAAARSRGARWARLLDRTLGSRPVRRAQGPPDTG